MFPSLTDRRTRSRIGILAVSLGTLAGTGLATATPSIAGSTQTYVVLYQAGASTSGATNAVSAAGGTLVANHAAIGVVIARSDSSTFASKIKNSAKVSGVAATGGLGTRAEPVTDSAAAVSATPSPGSDGEPLSGLQWDMTQINAFAAHEVSGGDSDVVVGDVDTGLDFTHPDLAPNYRADLSTDCSSGTPSPLLVGNDTNGHGTHTAGTIAAAVNGIGITGVAPNVGIAGIKSSNNDGYFFPEMVICAYMWVASHDIDVTNNSYFADPWLFNCRNEAGQRAIWEAERRAIRHAQNQGTVVVASQGNDSTDLSHPTFDNVSPDFPPGSNVDRKITNACAVVPVEVPGVVGVAATGFGSVHSFYSSYGISTADVAAPGGNSVYTADADKRRVLSTYPAGSMANCARPLVSNGATYCYLQGTSMAGPHAAGVAALLVSKGVHGQAVGSALESSATPVACSSQAYIDQLTADGFTQLSGAPQECTGGTAHNSFFGSGEVDALAAVS